MAKLEKLRAEYKAKTEKLKELRALEAWTDEQRAEINTLMDSAEAIGKDIDAEIRAIELDRRDIPEVIPPHIEVVDQPVYRGSASAMLGQQLLDIRTMCLQGGRVGSGEIKEARTRLEQCEKRTRDKMDEQAKKENRAAATGGFTIGTPSDGGFFLQGETSMDLMTTGFNNSVVLSRCQSRTLSAGTGFVEAYYIKEDSRATGSRGGGVRVYTAAELDGMTQSKTGFRKIRYEPHKLTGLYYASGEIVRNVTFLGQEMRQLFGGEFAFKCQDLVINGAGGGDPVGVMNAPCLVTQATETGQDTTSPILPANILHMESRLLTEQGACYLVNRELKPYLSTLSLAIGTAGTLVPLYQQQYYQGKMQASLNGWPCFTIEQCQAKNTTGDIILADFSKYVTANKGDINEAMSIHVNFLYDQDTFRFLYYFDGQPIYDSAITPYKGSATVGPFIALATRT